MIHVRSLLDIKLLSDYVLLICQSLYNFKQTVKNYRCIYESRKLDFEQISTGSYILRNKERNIILFLYVNDIFIATKIKT